MKPRKRSSAANFNPKRSIGPWNGSDDDLLAAKGLLKKVHYVGSPAHKRNPGDFGLTPPSSPRQHATLCDDAKLFRLKDAESLLEAGIERGLIDTRARSGFPSVVWSVTKGIAFEAQLQNEELGEYHGYPMAAADPLRQSVLEEFARRAPKNRR